MFYMLVATLDLRPTLEKLETEVQWSKKKTYCNSKQTVKWKKSELSDQGQK